MRYASAFHVGAAVETYNTNGEPDCTLVTLAKPRTFSHTAGSCGACQARVPGWRFSCLIQSAGRATGADGVDVDVVVGSAPASALVAVFDGTVGLPSAEVEPPRSVTTSATVTRANTPAITPGTHQN